MDNGNNKDLKYGRNGGNKTALRIALAAVLTEVVVVFNLLVRVPTPIKG